MELAGKHILILGLGESGLAMARWCARHDCRLTVADTRDDPPGQATLQAQVPQATLVCGAAARDVALLADVDVVAVSPGLDPRRGLIAAARERHIPVTGEVALFAAALEQLGVRAQTRVLAITGTNGKTTTTTLAAHLCAHAGLDAVAAGNISPAMLAVLCDRLEAGQALPAVWVLELSSFQLETAGELAADAATILNVTEDHLDRYDSLVEYTCAKQAIYAGCRCAVINRDDDLTTVLTGDAERTASERSPALRTLSFGLQAPAEGMYGLGERDGVTVLLCGDDVLLPVADMALVGTHNQANALAALALCEAIGVPRARLLAGLRDFRGLPHRVEVVARRAADAVVFIDDSKGTNVGATVAALAGLSQPVVLIAGGDGKGQDFAPLRAPVDARARAVVLIGRDAEAIEAALDGSPVQRLGCESLEEAVAVAALLAQPGDAVLLSPACASLDMFRNYAHRAQVFLDAALALPGVTRA